jgi:hypothetical protein
MSPDSPDFEKIWTDGFEYITGHSRLREDME